MRFAAQVQTSIDILSIINTEGTPADRVLNIYFRKNRYIGSKDKRAISTYVFAVIRQKLSLGYLLEQAGAKKITERLLLAASLMSEHENLNEIFNGQQYSPTEFNKREESIIDKVDFSSLESAPRHIRLNIPLWLEEKIEPSLGTHYEEAIQALNERATTDIRVNTLLSTKEKVLEQLLSEDIAVEETPISPIGLRFTERVSLMNHTLYQSGQIDIQDEGSQLLSLLTNVKAGDTVIDYCAGAGGKTLAMAAMMLNKGKIIACDIHSKRLEELVKRCKRAKAKIVSTLNLSDHKLDKFTDSADTVLIDAPCSGTGTWRRSPTQRWQLTQEALVSLLSTQQDILQKAAGLVKPGGQILYATCSILSEENEEQVKTFLKNNPDFKYGELHALAKFGTKSECFIATKHDFKTYPHLSNADGFYICAIEKLNT